MAFFARSSYLKYLQTIYIRIMGEFEVSEIKNNISKSTFLQRPI